MNELWDVCCLLVPEGAKLQHEVGDLQDHSSDPLVAWMDLHVSRKRSDSFHKVCRCLLVEAALTFTSATYPFSTILLSAKETPLVGTGLQSHLHCTPDSELYASRAEYIYVYHTRVRCTPQTNSSACTRCRWAESTATIGRATASPELGHFPVLYAPVLIYLIYPSDLVFVFIQTAVVLLHHVVARAWALLPLHGLGEFGRDQLLRMGVLLTRKTGDISWWSTRAAFLSCMHLRLEGN